jgi:hypothetical protein
MIPNTFVSISNLCLRVPRNFSFEGQQQKQKLPFVATQASTRQAQAKPRQGKAPNSLSLREHALINPSVLCFPVPWTPFQKPGPGDPEIMRVP